jgi:hypothetical protein
MAGLLPQMSLEPAPGYRRFVERHFDALRRDARRLAGDGPQADEFCSDVLADVALRWRWFELLRVRLRRPDPAGSYLGAALTRRIDRWRAEPVEVDDEPREIEVMTYRPAATAAVGWWPDRFVVDGHRPGRPAGRRNGPDGRDRPTSAAVRIAAVRPLPPRPPSAAVEAVIAWLHAYETYGRYRRVAAAVGVAAATVVLIRLRYLGAGP